MRTCIYHFGSHIARVGNAQVNWQSVCSVDSVDYSMLRIRPSSGGPTIVQAYKARLGRRQCSTTACSQSPVSAVYAIIWSIKPPKTMETGQLMGMGPLTVNASAASLMLRAKTQVIWWVSLATNIVLDPGTAFCEKYFFLVEDKSTHWVWSTWRCKASWIHDVC